MEMSWRAAEKKSCALVAKMERMMRLRCRDRMTTSLPRTYTLNIPTTSSTRLKSDSHSLKPVTSFSGNLELTGHFSNLLRPMRGTHHLTSNRFPTFVSRPYAPLYNNTERGRSICKTRSGAVRMNVGDTVISPTADTCKVPAGASRLNPRTKTGNTLTSARILRKL